jgi:hypothetical protein
MGMLSASWLQTQQVRIMPGLSRAELVEMFHIQYMIVALMCFVELGVNAVGLIQRASLPLPYSDKGMVYVLTCACMSRRELQTLPERYWDF